MSAHPACEFSAGLAFESARALIYFQQVKAAWRIRY
jgi:hypothetical protein